MMLGEVDHQSRGTGASSVCLALTPCRCCASPPHHPTPPPQIDDPAYAFPMHGCGGVWGTLFVGLLAKEDYVVQVGRG